MLISITKKYFRKTNYNKCIKKGKAKYICNIDISNGINLYNQTTGSFAEHEYLSLFTPIYEDKDEDEIGNDVFI